MSAEIIEFRPCKSADPEPIDQAARDALAEAIQSAADFYHRAGRRCLSAREAADLQLARLRELGFVLVRWSLDSAK